MKFLLLLFSYAFASVAGQASTLTSTAQQSISLSVSVFGDEYSKILWRAPRDEDERRIPPELYEQMDALFTHYLENEAKFKAEFLRNKALRKAREAYLKKNPPEPKDVIINHWPISKGGAR